MSQLSASISEKVVTLSKKFLNVLQENRCLYNNIDDGYCDDINNNELCGFDGNDCCNNKNPDWAFYCKDCSECLRSTNCWDEMMGDGYCDDHNNKAGCQFDGRDCCSFTNFKEENGERVWNKYCKECTDCNIGSFGMLNLFITYTLNCD